MNPVFWLDALLRWCYGVYEFCDDPKCLIRLRNISISHPLHLPDTTIPPGSPGLELHLWNEHIPPLPPQGPNMAWANQFRRMLIHSLRALARHIQNHPELADVRAVGGVTALFSPESPSGGVRLMHRLGFSIFPYHHPLGNFGEFWENFYAWMLIWSFNRPSLQGRRLLQLRRSEIWMSKEGLLHRYGDPSHSSQQSI